jgi:hypothetical protein
VQLKREKESSSLPQPQAPPQPEPSLSSPKAQALVRNDSTASAAKPPTGSPPAAAQAKPATIPNTRRGFKLTLWVSSTTEVGLADVHGFLQLDGADPVPFCRLKDVPNPLARALQEAFVAVERVRARPPRMTAPAPPTQVAPAKPEVTRRAVPVTSPSKPATQGEHVAAPKRTAAQPSLF